MTSETAMVKASQQAVAQYDSYGIEGLEGITPDDLVVPRLTILQPTSKIDGTAGHFHLNLDNSTKETVEAVILRISKSRVLWSGDPSAKAPECASTDGVTGRTYGNCKGCEFNRYDSSGTLKVCKAGFTVLLADPTNAESLFLLSAYGTSVSPIKVLLSQFITKHRAPFTVVTKFSTKAEKGDKGKYFVLVPTVIKALTTEEAAPFRDVSLAMQAVAIKEVEPEDQPGSVSAEIANAQEEVAQQNNAQGTINRTRQAQAPPAPPAELDEEQNAMWEGMGATPAPAKPQGKGGKTPF